MDGLLAGGGTIASVAPAVRARWATLSVEGSCGSSDGTDDGVDGSSRMACIVPISPACSRGVSASTDGSGRDPGGIV